jgi:DNA-binding transcriptional MerR regulator
MTAKEKKLLKVGDLAKAAGKTVRAIHLYEELGLLTPASRSTGGYRLYADDAVGRVVWITKLQEMGFSLPDIQALLREWETASTAPTGMRVVRAIFEEKLRETRETIARLSTLEKDLEASLSYLESCHSCEPTHVRTDCAVCSHHGHDPKATPELVAGLAKPERDWDVDLERAELVRGART